MIDDLLNEGLEIRPLFRDRYEAGARLAERLAGFRGADALVLGIPRGGVPVASEVARALDAELDVVVARKLGAPWQPELAIGAVTANGARYLNEALIAELSVTPAYLARVTAAEMTDARRREARLRAGRPPAAVAGRTVLVVDDGLATGATLRAALRAVRALRPARLVAAVPVAARETCDALRAERETVDGVACPHELAVFLAVGAHYADFTPTKDEEVQGLLAEAAARQLSRRQTSARPRAHNSRAGTSRLGL